MDLDVLVRPRTRIPEDLRVDRHPAAPFAVTPAKNETLWTLRTKWWRFTAPSKKMEYFYPSGHISHKCRLKKLALDLWPHSFYPSSSLSFGGCSISVQRLWLPRKGSVKFTRQISRRGKKNQRAILSRFISNCWQCVCDEDFLAPKIKIMYHSHER